VYPSKLKFSSFVFLTVLFALQRPWNLFMFATTFAFVWIHTKRKWKRQYYIYIRITLTSYQILCAVGSQVKPNGLKLFEILSVKNSSYLRAALAQNIDFGCAFICPGRNCYSAIWVLGFGFWVPCSCTCALCLGCLSILFITCSDLLCPRTNENECANLTEAQWVEKPEYINNFKSFRNTLQMGRMSVAFMGV